MFEPIEVESPHYSEKDGKPVLTKKTAIVIHDTGGYDTKKTLAWFLTLESKVSVHYVIEKTGEIYHLVPDEYVAWHAGKSSLWGVENVNTFSLGVELVDDSDDDKYPDPQLESLINLCTHLIVANKIPLNRVVGHQHVAPGRRVDPGPDFPWYEFLNTVAANVVHEELCE